MSIFFFYIMYIMSIIFVIMLKLIIKIMIIFVISLLETFSEFVIFRNVLCCSCFVAICHLFEFVLIDLIIKYYVFVFDINCEPYLYGAQSDKSD